MKESLIMKSFLQYLKETEQALPSARDIIFHDQSDPNDYGIEAIKDAEGLRLDIYDDQGEPAIGYGNRLRFVQDIIDKLGIKPEEGITEEQAEQLMQSYIDKEIMPEISRLFPNYEDWPVPALWAIIEMMYNLGIGTFNNFTNLISALQNDNISGETVSQEIRNSKWYRSGGGHTSRAERIASVLQKAFGSTYNRHIPVSDQLGALNLDLGN